MQVRGVMHAAYKLSEKEKMAKLSRQAKWLAPEYRDAAASLLEGLEETFTVNRLQLTPALIRCLASTNIIENPNGAARDRPRHALARSGHGAAIGQAFPANISFNSLRVLSDAGTLAIGMLLCG